MLASGTCDLRGTRCPTDRGNPSPAETRGNRICGQEAMNTPTAVDASNRVTFDDRVHRQAVVLRRIAVVLVQGVGAVRYRWTVGPSQSTISSRLSATLAWNRST